MRKHLLTIVILLLNVVVFGQQIVEDTYWFYFTDKENNGYSISQPLDFLSSRSYERRVWQNLPFNETDLPVTNNYVDSLLSLGLEVKFQSKWLNGVVVKSTDQQLIDTLTLISFISNEPWQASDEESHFLPERPISERFYKALGTSPSYKYGNSFNQIHQLNIDYLHDKGYTGKGVLIAVLDAGFTNLKELPAFQSVLAKEQIKYSRNFISPEEDMFSNHSHGTNVTSIIAANWPDTLMGIAPDVDLILAQTEYAPTETRLEEYAWIAAAEWADSLGADILNTSLGYTTFDDSTSNYSYEDMDGNTAHISIANSMVSSKGMISVTSAGNSGNEEWHYIGAPADARDILSVGAVDTAGVIAAFSSRGTTYDFRIKPEVSAMGVRVAIQSTDGAAKFGNGTSFASPMIAGATAVLWQAYPYLSANELMRSIIESADRYTNADAAYGYGIPNFKAAFHSITSAPNKLIHGNLIVYPNPFNNYITVDFSKHRNEEYDVKIYDLQGREVYHSEQRLPGRLELPASLQFGLYILDIRNNNISFKSRIIKN